MTSNVLSFDPREGGAFRISLTYGTPTTAGKTDDRTDTFHGRFVSLVPDREVVQVVEFESDDPAMRGEMTITYLLAGDGGGTTLTGRHDNLPPGVSAADNERGWRMSLDKLARLVESPAGTSGPPATSIDWDERYGGRDQVWSGEPNGALVAEVEGLPPGRALDVGCGEGADAIWLAARGWQVTALDVSRVALDRAAAAARAAGAEVQWVRAGLLEARLSDVFDLVSAQYPALLRTPDADAERALLAAVAPGGTLLVVHHDVDAEQAKAHDVDPADYVQPADVAALLDGSWELDVDERRPRHVTAGAGAHHTHDLVLRARRTGPLPRLDEHAAVIAADVDEVWRSLLETLDRTSSRAGAAGYARLVGCADRTASGPRPLAVGSTIPGFRVVAAVPGHALTLEGRHRFSSYALAFHLDDLGPGRSRLRAESRATFPGLAGGLYRRLVVGTGGHVVGVKRLLSAVRRGAE